MEYLFKNLIINILLKIRYLGKLDKIINQLKQQNIMLEFTNDQWNLKIKK